MPEIILEDREEDEIETLATHNHGTLPIDEIPPTGYIFFSVCVFRPWVFPIRSPGIMGRHPYRLLSVSLGCS